ncbi:MAG: beta strand repeat-containing protein, partial [Endozoicomonas sp.]
AVTIATDGRSLSFDPAEDWHGSTKTFTYRVTSENNTEDATVTINVNSVVDAVNDSLTIMEDELPRAIIPPLTSNTDQGFTVTASSFTDANHQPYHAFDNVSPIDGSNNNAWGSTGSTGWIQIQQNQAQHIAYYTITSALTADQAPADWVLEGSNDGLTFTTIDTVSGQGSWGNSETRTFIADNPGQYSFLRLNISSNNGGGHVIIDALQFFSHLGSLDVLANDSFGTNSRVDQITTGPTNGTVTIEPDGNTVTYTPNADFHGVDTYTYEVLTAAGNRETATVTVTVTPVIDAFADSVRISEDSGLIPSLSSANDQGYVITSSGNATTSHQEFMAFDNQESSQVGNSNSWATPPGTTGWLQVQMPEQTQVTSYDITAASLETRQPSDWILEGSNDGSTYTTLDTQSGVTWEGRETKTFTLGSAANFSYYRITISDNNGDVYTGFDSLQFFNNAGGSDNVRTIDVLDNDTFAAGATVAIASGDEPSHGTVTVNADNTLSYRANDDYHGSDSFTYTVTSVAGNTETETVTVTIDSVVDRVHDSLTTLEDAAADIDVLDNDKFESSATVTSTTHGTNGTVSINTNGTLKYTPDAHFNGTDSFTYTVTQDGVSETATVDVTITAVNDVPSFALPASPDQAVLEDAGAQTVAGFATSISKGLSNANASDDESGQTLTFNVTTSNSAAFAVGPAIDATTGNLTYTLADHWNGGPITVTVNLSDNGGTANGGVDTSANQTFTISSTSVNDVPSFTVGANQTVLEDAGAQTVAGFATNISKGLSNPDATDTESSQSLTFNITTDNNSAFAVGPAIDATTGDLTYILADHWNGGPITVTVNLSDDGGTANGGVDRSADQTFTISSTTVNDVPSFSLSANPDQTVLEDAGAQTVAGFATSISKGLSNADATDDESTQTLTFNVTTNNSAAFAVGPAIDASTGDLTYTLADHWNGGPITVTVNLSDTGGTANGGVDTSANQTFTISSTSVNDVPSFNLSASPNQTVQEDSGAQTVSGFATSISKGLSNPDATDDESGQTLTFNVSTDNNAAFTAGPAIDTGTGDLTYTLTDHWNGVINITVTLSDDGGTSNGGVDTSAGQTFSITVTPVNDAPVFGDDSGLSSIDTVTQVPSGSTIDELFADLFTDPIDVQHTEGAHDLAGIAITGNQADPVNEGVWEYSTDGGANWHAVGDVSATSALLLENTDSVRLRFMPVYTYIGAPGQLEVHAVDDSTTETWTSGASQKHYDTTTDDHRAHVSQEEVTLTTETTGKIHVNPPVPISASTDRPVNEPNVEAPSPVAPVPAAHEVAGDTFEEATPTQLVTSHDGDPANTDHHQQSVQRVNERYGSKLITGSVHTGLDTRQNTSSEAATEAWADTVRDWTDRQLAELEEEEQRLDQAPATRDGTPSESPQPTPQKPSENIQDENIEENPEDEAEQVEEADKETTAARGLSKQLAGEAQKEDQSLSQLVEALEALKNESNSTNRRL